MTGMKCEPANFGMSPFSFECLQIILKLMIFTLNSKRKHTLWVSASKYSKPRSCRTHDSVWGPAIWSSIPNKTNFVKKFKMVPKFWSKAWGHAVYQPVASKSMTKTDFYELSDMTSQQTVPWSFGTIWIFFTKPGSVVAELWLAALLSCRGFCSTYILSTRLETKCILSFGAGRVYKQL